MQDECAKSCDVCEVLVGGEEEEVEDLPGHVCADTDKRCPEWAAAGECSVNPVYMKKGCKDACWVCFDADMDRRRGVSEDIIEKKKIYRKMELGTTQMRRGLHPTELSAEENVAVTTTIQKMEGYAKFAMTDSSISATARANCRNDYRMCAEWASRGFCDMDVVFMLNFCPLACRTCEDTEQFHRCAGRRHPLAPAAMDRKSGLDSLFQSIKSGGEEWDAYRPEFVSYPNENEGDGDDPYIVILQDFLSDEEADHLVSLGSALGWTPSYHGSVGKSWNEERTSIQKLKSSSCFDSNACSDDPVYQRIVKRMSSVTHVNSSNFEPLEFVKYDQGDYKDPAHDFELSSYWKPAGAPVLSMFLFLSDVDDGGELGFPDLDWLLIEPKKGTAVLWHNVMRGDASEVDEMINYEHFPVGLGTKYGAQSYAHMYSWTDAHSRGCA